MSNYYGGFGSNGTLARPGAKAAIGANRRASGTPGRKKKTKRYRHKGDRASRSAVGGSVGGWR